MFEGLGLKKDREEKTTYIYMKERWMVGQGRKLFIYVGGYE